MLKLTSRQLSTYLLLIIIFYCSANPTKETKGGGKSPKAAKEKSSSSKKGSAVDEDELLLVNTTCGFVKGRWQKTLFTNTKFRSFRGIPYAEKPLGKLRFRKPEEKKPWNETFAATEYGCSCLETTINDKSKKKRSEDCLFLNIFTPANIPEGKKLPVMFFVHGGGFNEGDGDDKYYCPDPFMEKGRDVILVTINYRLGIFGFLCIDDEISGNAGLMDQQVALQWIDKNIERFGGDKGCKTMFGQSAGGQSTHYHMLSPVSRPLLKRCISISGFILYKELVKGAEQAMATLSAFMAFFLSELKAFNKGKSYNFGDGMVLLKKYLETVPAQVLQKKFVDSKPWVPVIETTSAKKSFMTMHPLDTYATQSVDIEAMFGITTAEVAIVFNRQQFEMVANNLEVINLNIDGLKYQNDPAVSPIYMKALEGVIKCYIPDMKVNASSDEDFCKCQKMLSDVGAAYRMEETARLHSVKSKFKPYMYIFDVNTKLNYASHALVPGLELASHSDDMPYLFLSKAIQKTYEAAQKSKDPKDVQAMAMCKSFLDFFIDFAKTGFKDNKKGYVPITGDDAKAIYVNNDGIKSDGYPYKKVFKVLRQVRKDLRPWITSPLLSTLACK